MDSHRARWRRAGRRIAGIIMAAVLAALAPTTLGGAASAANVPGRLLSGVDCTSATSCWAVGVSTTSAGVTTTLIEHWNGSAWSVVSSPNVSGASITYVASVACTSASNCWAAGGATLSSKQEAIAEHWNGGNWSLTVLPGATGQANNSLASVSCPTATSCMATGSSSQAGFSSGPTLAERWNGTKWSVVPTAKTSNGGLNAVSCTSTTNCWAVGISAGLALAERWNGSSWSAASTPSNGQDMFGVSCMGSTCLSAGIATSSFGIAERWNGSGWATTPTPNPSGATFSEFTSMSCTTSTACTMAGYYFTTLGKTLIETWNGSSWKVVPSPNPTGSTLTTLHGVFCNSTKDCWAVGLHQQKAGQNSTLAEHWNGTRWSIITTP